MEISNYKTKTINSKDYIVFNVSDGFDNWSQRNSKYIFSKGNNVINWADLCNVHAYTDFLEIVKADIDNNKYAEFSRLPDKLAKHLCESKDVDDYYKSFAYSYWEDWDKGKSDSYSPCEVHGVLCFGVNNFIGKTISKFDANYKIENIIYDIAIRNKPVITSGKYCGMNHVVCLVGAAWEKDKIESSLSNTAKFEKFIKKTAPDYMIIDDPWGDMTTNYSSKIGNDCFVEWDDFISNTKPLNNKEVKYAHYYIG